MKVLVTGANGLLAANTIRELNKRGIAVRGMVRKTSNLLSLEGAVYEKVFGDITNHDDVMVAAENCDAVIHAAAITSQNPRHQKSESDIEGTRNVIDTVAQKNISRLVYVSSANTFGFGSLMQPGTENSPMSPVFQKSAYARKKLAAQNLVLEAARSGKINAVVVNPTFIVGACDSKPSSGRLLMTYLKSKTAIYPPGGKNFVSAGDAAVAICNSLKKGRSGECYLLAGENLSYKKFYEKIKQVSGISKRMIALPKILLKGLGWAGSLANKFGFATELTKENADILCIKNYYSSYKAQNELDMPQTPIVYAVEESFKWFLAYNYFRV